MVIERVVADKVRPWNGIPHRVCRTPPIIGMDSRQPELAHAIVWKIV